MEFTQENFDKLQADLAVANEKNQKLDEDLKNATEKISGLAEANDSLQKEVDRLLKTSDKEEAVTGVGKTFEYETSDDEGKPVKRTFKVLCSKITLPKLGSLTALEILTNDQAKEWLVKNKSEMIKEVF